MKKIALLIVTALLLLTSLTSCSSCSRKPNHVDEETTPLFERPLSEEYATPIIHKNGDSAYYVDKSVEDLEALFLNSSRNSNSINLMMFPTGTLFSNIVDSTGAPQMYFYNKLTGNISTWCADPLCTHELEKCVWSAAEILYIGTDKIVFQSAFDGDNKLYICDMQRNNVREIYDIAEYSEEDKYTPGSYDVYLDMVIVEHLYNDLVYVQYTAYSENGSGMEAIYTIDLNTREFKKCFDIPQTVSLLAWIGDSVFYRDSAQSGKILRADLNFKNSEVITKGDSLAGYTDRYLVVNEYVAGEFYPKASCVYDLQTKQTYDLPDVPFHTAVISGDYIYYKRKLTEEEMENDPMKDYYTWEWEYKRKRINAQTQGAGKLYRVKIGENKEECVLQLTYKDVPVRIESFTADGEMLYFSFRNHEQFKNYLNQDYAETTTEPVTFAVADLQSGTVRVFDFTNVE